MRKQSHLPALNQKRKHYRLEVALALFLVISLLFSSFPRQLVPPARADSSTLSVSRDAHIQEDDPTANFGSANDLKVRSKSEGNNRRALVEFDLSAIPSGAFIESATLRVFMNNAPGISRTYEVHRLTKNWVESQVTWNKRTGASWTTPGGDFDATVIATQTTGTTSSVWLEWDVTTLVQDWVNGTSNFGLLLIDSNEDSATSYEAKFNSSEGASDQPELVVVWDTTAPSDPTNLTSPSHTTSTWSSDNTVDVTWTAATDNAGGSGVDGYSIEWSTSASTVPDAVKDLEESATSTTSPQLADGDSNYFHIRTCDNAGNCTSTLHLGPFWIDTTPPDDPLGLTSLSHIISLWSNDNTVDLVWIAAADTGSGLDGYSILWDTNPLTLPDTSLELEETEIATTSPGLADGNSHYFHIRSCDNVGNCTSTLHLGPFFIDSPAPSDPSDLASTSHTPGVWSSDNTVGLTWSTPTDTGGSGLDGYSIVWDTNPATEPDTILELQETDTSTTSPELDDGNSHYLHLATCDNATNCTNTLHLGPFFIDTTSPFVTDRHPAPGETAVNPYTNIVLHLRDAGAGLKKSSIILTVEGVVVTPVITGTADNYKVSYYPGPFLYGEEIKVSVEAEDKMGNDMAKKTYSFRIADSPTGDSTPTPTPTPTSTPTPTPTASPTSTPTSPSSPTPTLTPTPTSTPDDSTPTSEGKCAGFWYTVQPGDWIYALARQFGVTPEQILAANNLSDPDQLQPGQEICIPGSAAETETPTPTATTEPTETPTPTPSPTPTLEPPVVGQTTPEPTPPNNPPSQGLGFPFGLGGLLPWLFLILGFLGGVLVTSGVYRWRARQA